ncbi:MAG: fimbrillin family protein [Bacteroides sp.]|nr:fimbrillin family protein [Bacteroides sp.]
MKKTRQLVTIGLLATGLVALYGCSSDIEGESGDKKVQPVELKVQTSITLGRALDPTTKGAITGTAFTENDKIAVYANSSNYNSANNNYAVYKFASSSWASEAGNKIYLSIEDATIYAVYPHDLTVEHTSAVSGTTTASGLLLHEGGTSSADNNNKIDLNNAATGNIHAAQGEIDFMYATPATERNATTQEKCKATLAMQHALAMISFKFYKDDTFNGDGKLTKIELKDTDETPSVFKTGNATMQIGDGTISVADNGSNKKLTRFLYTNSTTEGYTLLKLSEVSISGGSSSSDDDKKAYLPAFSMLAYPLASFGEDKIKATFTIDGLDYTMSLPELESGHSDNFWKAGYNTIYTVKMSGKEPTLSVSVTEWQDASVGDIAPIK